MCESVGVFIAKTVAVELNVKIVPKYEVLTSWRGNQEFCQEREELAQIGDIRRNKPPSPISSVLPHGVEFAAPEGHQCQKFRQAQN